MVMVRVWTTCKHCGQGPIPEEAKKAHMALCQSCYDGMKADEVPLEQSGVLEWSITDVDYFEQDAYLNLGNERFYFQFSEHPTLEDALDFIRYEKKPT